VWPGVVWDYPVNLFAETIRQTDRIADKVAAVVGKPP
jgi:hypothetical protein